jgi:MFS family permease
VRSPSEAERARLAHRISALLAGAQVALWGALGAWAAFGPITIFELSHRESLAAVQIGLYYVGAAAGARVAGRFMDRAGRRPGLAAGYVAVAASGGVCAAAVVTGSFPVLLAGSVVLGVGAGAALLGRAAVADMYPPDRRGRAVGTLLVAGTVGAVGGPPLAGAVHAVARNGGWADPLVAPWLLVPALGAVALGLVLAVRPDPRDLASEPPGGPVRRPSEILRLRPGLVAAATMVAAQAVMVTFMGVVPVVLHSHGAGEVTVALVVSFHLAGMFAFSRFVGAALDRWGRRAGLLAGVAISASGALLSLATGSTLIPAAGLVLIGIGWSAAYVGSTAVISDLATLAERAGALGLVDLVASLAAAVGVLGGALVLDLAGIGALVGAAVVVLAVAVAFVASLRPVGRPEVEIGPEG